jgi:hypothetical protein
MNDIDYPNRRLTVAEAEAHFAALKVERSKKAKRAAATRRRNGAALNRAIAEATTNDKA